VNKQYALFLSPKNCPMISFSESMTIHIKILWPSIRLLTQTFIYYILGTVLSIEEKAVNKNPNVF